MRFNHAIIDLETNILNKEIGSNKASPFYPKNGIVLGQYRRYDDISVHPTEVLFSQTRHPALAEQCVAQLFEEADMLVGHNIKFDLLYLRKFYNQLYRDWIKRGGTVWDTQIVEYLLSGQSHLYPSLDQCSEKYGGTLKDDKIKEYWKNDIDTADIPKEELSEYLEHDINNTELVLQKQWEAVEEQGMLPLVVTQMNALLALVEMEYNGLAFDDRGAADKCAELVLDIKYIEEYLVDQMGEKLPKSMPVPITPNSPQQLSAVLFGGEVKIKWNEPVLDDRGLPVRFKSGLRKGEIKTRKVSDKVTIVGFDLIPVGERGKGGYYSTDDEALKKIIDSYKHMREVHEFCGALLKYRELAKDINTYYIGYSKLVFPDGLIHPNFNQCSTATGRLSSNNPNAQNLSKKEE